MTRPLSLRIGRKGALAEVQFMMAVGRRESFSHSSNSTASRSGPIRLNLAFLPSKVPCPMSTSQRAELFSLARIEISFWIDSLTVPFSTLPRWWKSAPPFVAACFHCPVHLVNSLPYSSEPGAPVRTITVGLSAAYAPTVIIMRNEISVRFMAGLCDVG